jgi:hypothetical protein
LIHAADFKHRDWVAPSAIVARNTALKSDAKLEARVVLEHLLQGTPINFVHCEKRI